MTGQIRRDVVFSALDRRVFLSYAAAAGAAAILPSRASAQASKTGVDLANWTPQYIARIAGTQEYDTAA